MAGLGSTDPKARVKAVKALGDSADGFRHLGQLSPLLLDESVEVRVAVVLALIGMRVVTAQPLLIEATKDLSPRVQALAVDGLVDFYVPDYVRTGRLAAVKALASRLKDRFSQPSPLVVSAYVDVNPDAVKAIGEVLRVGRSTEARANAARALGILRGGAEVETLLEGVRSRNSTTIVESVLAIKKVQATSAGPDIVFLLRDPESGVQEAVIVTVGQLRTREAGPGLVRIIEDSENGRLRALALTSLAKLADSGQRDLFTRYLGHNDKLLRAAAAEGLGRIANPDDTRLINDRLLVERAPNVKLSLAFAAVKLGDSVALQHLIEALNSSVRRLEARPFLVELARDGEVLARLYSPLTEGTVAQRRHLAFVLSQSGNQESVPHLEVLTNDSNNDVAGAAIEALRVLRAGL